MTTAQTTVWLPGGGAPAAFGAIKSLRLSDERLRLVTTDANPLSAGFAVADAYEVLPPVKSPDYLDRALSWVRTQQVRIVLPTSGFDLEVLAHHRALFASEGVRFAFSDYEQICLCNDKLRLMRHLEREFPLAWFTSDVDQARFPCFVKPVHGKGGRGAAICHSPKELTEMWERSKEPLLIQEYLSGTEYSVDVLSDLAGRARYAVVRVRIETRGGISSKGQVRRHPLLESASLQVADYVGLKGPTCFQWREDVSGTPRLLEINPRLGGATIIATLAGANLPLDAVRLALGEEIAPRLPQEIVVLRVFDEVVWDGGKTRLT